MKTSFLLNIQQEKCSLPLAQNWWQGYNPLLLCSMWISVWADRLLIYTLQVHVINEFAGPNTDSGIGDLKQSWSRRGLPYTKRDDKNESIFSDDILLKKS